MTDVQPRDVTPNFKAPKVTCPCAKNCGAVGIPTKGTGHPRQCTCPKCLAGRNSRQGKAAHRRIARELGAATSGRGSSSHEESWVHAFRLEAKTGAQAGPVITRYKASRAQSEVSRAIGDNRPFAAIYDSRRKGDPVVAVVDLETFKAMTLIAIEVTA